MRALAAIVALSLSAGAAAADRLTLATWNLEWMMAPHTFDELAARCLKYGQRAGGNDRAIPCNIVPKARWNDDDLAHLRAFAATLPLDVIALQETDGPEAAALVFPDREFCFTKRKHVQNVGFAIRRGIPFRCHRDYRPLGLPGNDVRWGSELTLYPGTTREIRLLGVHLKSGCNMDSLASARPECRVLQQQVPELERWIDRRAELGEAFAVLGDFNRRFDREQKSARDAFGNIAALWPEINDGEPAGADLLNAGADHGLIICGNGEAGRAPVDHLVLGRKLARRLVPGSFTVWRYRGGSRHWPDHCLISIELNLEPQNGL